MMLNIGDAASSREQEQKRINDGIYYPEDIENDVLKIFAHYFQNTAEKIKGYVTTGGTEANLAAIWWQRNAFRNQSRMLYQGEMSHFRMNPIVIASDQSHYSCAKVAEILDLELITVKSTVSGEINLNALAETIKFHCDKHPERPLILWLNAGTTVLGAIDNIVEAKKICLAAHPQAKIKIHVDGAVLGAALPIIMPACADIFRYVDTLTISGHKLLGTPLASGVVLAKKEIIDLAFINKNTKIAYVHGIHDITVTGCRSALPIFQLHKALHQLGLASDAANFRKLILTCLNNANYLSTQLILILGAQHVNYEPGRLNVIFNLLLEESDANKLKEKYTLMPLPNQRACITVFANVDRKLISDFISEYREYLSKNTMELTKYRCKL